jgi:hypothetical protein
MSYNGKIFWGFNADYGHVSDIATFVKCIRKSFEQLAQVAGVELSDEYYGRENRGDGSKKAESNVKKIKADN